ncbi:MAG: MtnX-like HAD-IB family phosphatase [Hyphomicrobiaceae bacterium]
MRTNVYVDFDGTISPEEPTDALFDRFADPAWRQIEQEWQTGRLTSRECMAKQISMLRATPEEIDEYLSDVGIDPAFPEFVRLCQRHGARVVVVSDGLDKVVGTVLRSAGLELPYFANALTWQGGDRWSLEFPYSRHDCRFNMGNCKCSHSSPAPRDFNILVGDGRSDFCIAQRSDLVLAKGTLATHCLDANVDHHRILDFSDAVRVMSKWFRVRERSSVLHASAG